MSARKNKSGRIIKVKDNKPFTVIRNAPLQNKELSWKAKGLLSYLMSLPEDWKIYLNELSKHSKDGIDSTTSGMKELMTFGYVTRERTHNSRTGQFEGYDYFVSDYPRTETGKSNNGEKQGFTVNGLSNNGKPVNGKSNTTKETLKQKKHFTKETNYKDRQHKVDPSQNGFEKDLKTPIEVNGKGSGEKRKEKKKSSAPKNSTNWTKKWSEIFNSCFQQVKKTKKNYQFQKRDYGDFASIKKMLINLYKDENEGQEPTDKAINDSFEWLCKMAAQMPWLKENYRPANFTGQFNKIVTFKTEEQKNNQWLVDLFNDK